MLRPRTLARLALVCLGPGSYACSAAPTSSTGPSRPGSPSPAKLDEMASEPTLPAVGAGDTDEPALTRDEIRTVVRAKLPEVRACFAAPSRASRASEASEPSESSEPSEPESASEDTPLRARVELGFTIEADGKARAIEVLSNDLPDDPGEAAAACLIAALGRWQFPRPRDGRSVAVRYPFVYSSEAALRAAGLPRVEGTVTPEAVGAVFEARAAELDPCIPAAAHGRVGVAFVVDDGGRVVRISSYLDELPEGATACLVRAISAWAFPPAAPGDEARINHELRW